MRTILTSLLLVVALLFPTFSNAAISSAVESMQCNAPFVKTVHICGTTAGKGNASGKDYSNCLPFADQDLWRIPAGTLISKVYAKIDVAITGTTALTVGDDDGATSYITDLAASFATPGVYGWDAKTAGAYLRIQTAGATDAADVYVVPTAKYYGATGKEVKLDITTANTAGSLRVFIEGHKYCDAY